MMFLQRYTYRLILSQVSQAQNCNTVVAHWLKVGEFKLQHCQAAIVGSLSKALNPLCCFMIATVL